RPARLFQTSVQVCQHRIWHLDRERLRVHDTLLPAVVIHAQLHAKRYTSPLARLYSTDRANGCQPSRQEVRHRTSAGAARLGHDMQGCYTALAITTTTTATSTPRPRRSPFP